jgi:UDP-glucose 4-epimerase
MNRSILLAGGSGFIGCHLVRALTQAGAACAVADRAESPGLPIGTEFHRTSLSDAARLRTALLGRDTLIYLAHETSVAPVAEQSKANLSLNLATFQNVLDAAADAGVSTAVLFSSGGAVYGRMEPNPVGEEAPTRPVSIYGKTKLAMEQVIHEASKRTGLCGLVLRPSNVYGPGQNFRGQQGIIPVGLARIAQDEAIPIYGDGSAIKDYLFIDDLCSTVVALLRGEASGVFNVGSGLGISLSKLLALLGSIVGRTPHLKFEPAIPGDVHFNVLDCSKIREAIGWHTAVSLEEGIKKTWEWIRPRLPH